MDLFFGLVALFFLSIFLLLKIFLIFNNFIFYFNNFILFIFLSFFLSPFLLSHVADRVLVLWPGVRPVPLRWNS